MGAVKRKVGKEKPHLNEADSKKLTLEIVKKIIKGFRKSTIIDWLVEEYGYTERSAEDRFYDGQKIITENAQNEIKNAVTTYVERLNDNYLEADRIQKPEVRLKIKNDIVAQLSKIQGLDKLNINLSGEANIVLKLPDDLKDE